MSATTAPPARGRLQLVLALVLALMTAAGGWRVTHAIALSTRDTATAVSIGGVRYAVTHAEQVVGLSDTDLGGMSHGIQGLVGPDQLLVRVSLVVRAGDAPAAYDAQSLRIYADNSTPPTAPVGGSFLPGRLNAHSSIEGALSFVVPRTRTRLSLGTTTSGGTVPLLELKAVGPTAPPASPHHTS